MKRFTLGLLWAITLLYLLSGCSTRYSETSDVPAQDSSPSITGVVDHVDFYPTDSSPFNRTVIVFEDGRIKAFKGLCRELFWSGKTHNIYQNAVGEIIRVEIINAPNP